MLLAIFSCSILVNSGSKFTTHSWGTLVLAILVGLLLLDFKKWILSYIVIILSLCLYLPYFPRLANHTNVEIFVGIFFTGILLITLVFKTALPKAQVVNNVFRITLIALYFIAGFHKLNSGFFCSDGSCSTAVGILNNRLLNTESVTVPYYYSLFTQVSTIIIEMIIPFGILFKSTRKITVFILAGFHFYLSLCGFYNFSAFAAFLIAGSIINIGNNNLQKDLIKSLRYFLLFSILAVTSTKFLHMLRLLPVTYLITYAGVIFNIGWVLFFYNIIKTSDNSVNKYKFSWLYPAIASVILVWGSQCYVGLSTASSLSMFSNLITEKEHCNHFIIDTKKTKIWDFEEDNVVIVNIPDKCKMNYIDTLKDYGLPLIEFKKCISQWTKFNEPIPCTLIYKGQTIFVPDLRNSKFNTYKIKWWHRFLYYRKINLNGNECLW